MSSRVKVLFPVASNICAVGVLFSLAGCLALNEMAVPVGSSESVSGVSNTDTGGTTAAGAPASLAISDGPTYAFPSTTVGATSSKTFTISNSGGVAATLDTISSIGLGLSAPLSLSGGTCATGGSVAASGTCTIIVQFAPTSAITSTPTISLSYNDGSATQSTTRALSGAGTTPATLAFTAPSNFGTVIVGNTTSAQNITITNSGGSTATNVYVSLATGTQFAISTAGGTNTCGVSGAKLSVAASTTCVFDVTFAPTTAGVKSDTATVTYDNGVATAQTGTASLGGTGLAAA